MSDVDQRTALAALREQGARCATLLREISVANARIVSRASGHDAVWQRVAASGYNRTCEIRAQKPMGFGQDPYWEAIKDDPDLKTICDSRWLLGEAADDLRARLERLDTIAPPYDDLEKCIRRSITGIDRTPAEIAEGATAALALATSAAAWRPPERDDDPTLADRWIRRLKNHPLGAAIFIAALALAAATAIFGNLSRAWPSRAPATAQPQPVAAPPAR